VLYTTHRPGVRPADRVDAIHAAGDRWLV